MTDPGQHEALGLLSHAVSEEASAWRRLVLPVKDTRSSIPFLRRITKDADPSEIKGWVTLSDKPPRPAKMIAENEEQLEWMVEEGEYQFCHKKNYSYKAYT